MRTTVAADGCPRACATGSGFGEAFAEAGLPDPVPDDGRVHRIQKVKPIRGI